MENKIKIFIACHKPTYLLENSLLIPVQVGAGIAEKRIPGMQYDDDGDNISEKNKQYCELTAQYWAWKNVEAEYYGFFHYRRYLSFDRVYAIGKDGRRPRGKRPQIYTELDDIREDLTAYCLTEEKMESVIKQYDMLTILREHINTTVYHQFCQYHSPKAIDEIVDILKDRHPEYTAAALEYLESRDIYYMNMFIMKKTLFMEYASWLFDILEAFERDFSLSGKMEDRLLGYLAERLFGVFYTYQRQKGVLCAELPYLKFYDTDLEKEGGSVERGKHIRTFQIRPTKLEIKIDMRKFNKLFPAGSKRRIMLRNIFLR